MVPWSSIAQLYHQLLDIAPTLGAHVGHAVAVGESQGPALALHALIAIAAQNNVTRYAPYWVAHAYWLAKHGDTTTAIASYQKALRLHTGPPERSYLQQQINLL